MEKSEIKRFTVFENDSANAVSCSLDDAYCITCSDEAVQAQVLQVDEQTGLAVVQIGEATEEVDTTLLETVRPGDILLVHGGVALGYGSEAEHV